jgi:hypothetical protein
VFCSFSVFMLRSYRPLGRSLGMSTLAVTFPCWLFFLGSGIHIPFPYLPPPHHMECIFMSENIFSELCLISFLPIFACFHRYLWPMSFSARSTLLWFLPLCFQISWRHRYKPSAVLFDFFLWVPSIFTLSCLLHEYDIPYFFLAEVFYTGYIFSSTFPTALLLL